MASTPKTKIKRKTLLYFLLPFFLLSQGFAHRVSFEGFSDTVFIDLPEEFKLEDAQEDSFLLQCEAIPVRAIVRIYPEESFSSPKDALFKSIQKLSLYSSDFRISSDTSYCASYIEGDLEGKTISGLACAVFVPSILVSKNLKNQNNQENKVSGGKIIFLLCYQNIEKNKSDDFSFFIESVIDSLCVSSESLFSPGFFTTLYHPDSGKNKKVSLLIDGKKIETEMDSESEKNSTFLVEREYKVLLLYQNSERWKEAWQRYYRMIFKDSCKRLQKVSFDITSNLAPEAEDETDLAQKLLFWTQGFSYERETTKSDFTSLPSVIIGKGSDCDSRSLLIAVILQSIGIDSILFVSSEYKHAVVGLASSHPGFGFTVEGKRFLTGETTAKGLTWGMISADQTDEAFWIPVVFP